MGKPSAKRFSREKPYVSRQTKAADQSGMCFGGTYRFFDAFLFEGVDKEARSLYLLPKNYLSYCMSIRPDASLANIGLAAPISTVVGIALNIAFYIYWNRKNADS